MNVLFVDSYLDIVPWGIYFNPGVASIAAVLKQNSIKSDHIAVFNRDDIKRILIYIKNNNVQIVGFTVTEPALKSIAEISNKIKKEFPNIYIVCGGLHTILNPEDVLEKVNCDAICIAEGEYAMLKLVQCLKTNSSDIYHIKNLWFKKNGKTIKNPLDKPIDINNLPDPNREIFLKNNLDIYEGNIYLKNNKKGCITTVSRGCYFNCSFCGNQFLNIQYKGKYRRLLDPKIAVNQLQRITKKYDYDYIIFIDAQFPTNEKWVEKFTRLYKKKVNIPFTVQLRFGSFTGKTTKLLKKAGCYFVQIGLESGDKDLRFKILNKKIDHKMIVDGIEMFKKEQIKIGVNNIIGIPTETPEKFINTIQTNAYLNPDYSYLFIYYPYKGTELYKYCLKNNLLRKHTKYFTFKADVTLKLKKFKRKDVLYYYSYYQALLLIFKKSLYSNKFERIIWKKLFEIYSICPSKRKGISGLYASITEKLFFDRILSSITENL